MAAENTRTATTVAEATPVQHPQRFPPGDNRACKELESSNGERKQVRNGETVLRGRGEMRGKQAGARGKIGAGEKAAGQPVPGR